MPQLVMLAGPNGAGKSTFYDAFLADSPLPFLNADLFAAETGVDSLEAARILDATRARMIEDGLGFITETVFSDPYGEKVGLLRDAMQAGYEVSLIYIGIANAALSSRRIDQRIGLGLHRSLTNLKQALTFVPIVELFDNSRIDEPYVQVATFKAGMLEWRAAGKLPAWCRGIVPARRNARAKSR